MMADREKVGFVAADDVQVAVAHDERTTPRAGDVLVKIDANQTRTDIEVAAMAMAPVPTPAILWRQPPALARGHAPLVSPQRSPSTRA